MGCARCHDHKYDPLSQKEFFQLFAYFNNIGEKGIGKGASANPVMQISSPLVEAPAEVVEALAQAKARQKEVQGGFNERRDAWARQKQPSRSTAKSKIGTRKPNSPRPKSPRESEN